MIDIKIPGYKAFSFKHLLLDYNGTLAADGILLPGVKEKLTQLSKQINIIVVTADTFGTAARQLRSLPVEIKVIPEENQREYKGKLVDELGGENVFRTYEVA